MNLQQLDNSQLSQLHNPERPDQESFDDYRKRRAASHARNRQIKEALRGSVELTPQQRPGFGMPDFGFITKLLSRIAGMRS